MNLVCVAQLRVLLSPGRTNPLAFSVVGEYPFLFLFVQTVSVGEVRVLRFGLLFKPCTTARVRSECGREMVRFASLSEHLSDVLGFAVLMP
jgi:hypothetical protein